MIPFKRINLGNSYEKVKPLFESGMIGLGDNVFEFEQALAKYVGAKHVIALNSCTSAISLSALWAYGKEGLRKVSIPSMTVPLVANALLQAGIEISFDNRTDWVGVCYDLRGSTIVDSAHELRRNCFRTHQAVVNDRKLKMCFSFYPTKTIGCSDGGAIATNDDDFATWARSASVYGRNQSQKRENSWDYEVDTYGYKMNFTNLQAVIALEQLNRLDETNKRRQAVVDMYNTAFDLANHSDYLYRIKVFNRDRFIEKMLSMGVECGVHFKPLHQMTPFQNIAMLPSDREDVDQQFSETVSLPLYDTLEMDEVIKVIKSVKSTGDLI